MGAKTTLGVFWWVVMSLMVQFSLGASLCGFEVQQQNKLYKFSLTSPLKNYPHGVLSEDGFYKISQNNSESGSETKIWFQLCEQMVFNHDPPKCIRCQTCGGPLHCGLTCSALVVKNVAGYYTCETLGYAANSTVSLIDTKSPGKGVRLNMSASTSDGDCSLSISVQCNANGVQAPTLMSKSGKCNYITTMMHPAGCPVVMYIGNKGFGWIGTLLIVLLCIFAAYLLIGMVYRFFILGIRGKEVFPRNNQLGRSLESSINFDQNMFHTFEGVRSQESRLLWNRNGCNQKPTSAVGNLSEWLQNMAGSTYQSSVEATLTSAGPAWSQSGLTSSNMKYSSPHVSTASVENRTSKRPAGANSQAKRQSSSAVHSQSDHAVIVIDDSPDVDAVPNLSGLEPTSFSGQPNKFQEGNSSVGGISNYDSILRSAKAWPQVSSIPSLFSSCQESSVARGSNLQRAKEVQAELRRLGITNPGNYVQPLYAVHSQSEPEIIIIDDTPDEEAVSNLPLLEPTSFNAQPRQFQEANYNSMFRSGNTWAQVSSIPSHFSACKESTLSCGLNHQRAKEVQAELRRLGITNPGIAQSSSSFLKPMRGG